MVLPLVPVASALRQHIRRELGQRRTHRRVEPFLADQNLINASGMHREGDQRELPGGDLGGDTRSMRFVASRIGICSENDEVDCGLGPGELDGLFEIGADRLFATHGGSRLVGDSEGEDALTAAVGHPECLNPRIVVDMAEHVTVVLVAANEPDGRKDALGRDREKLEYGAVLPADDDAPVDEGQRGGGLVSRHLQRPERQFVTDVPQRQGGILRNGGESEVGNIEIKCNKPLQSRYISNRRKEGF